MLNQMHQIRFNCSVFYSSTNKYHLILTFYSHPYFYIFRFPAKPSRFSRPRPPLALSIAHPLLGHLIALASLIHSHQNCFSIIASIYLCVSFALRTPLLPLLIPISYSNMA
ncbi:hypothetical protein VNO78_09158 [Psophocarpus tetragonolobus]|uniref:Uncharacterized protein n=1 Tax=Psophocarpus tetragonolobus TaxID=3891 RepID=A0AAN9SYY5_PSOTE